MQMLFVTESILELVFSSRLAVVELPVPIISGARIPRPFVRLLNLCI